MRILILSTSLLASLLLAACQRPPTPNPEKPPVPRAINDPLDRAKDVQKTVDDAAARERKAEADARQ